MQYECRKCGWIGEVKTRPRCLACYAKRMRKWRQDNPEKHKAQKSRYDKRFREQRRDEYNAKRRRLYVPKTAREAWKRRIEWLLDGDVTRIQLIEIYEKASGKCNYCGQAVKARFTPTDPRGFDHVKPRFKNGKHTAGNLVVCCKQCNATRTY